MSMITIRAVFFLFLTIVSGCTSIPTNLSNTSTPPIYVTSKGIGSDRDRALKDSFNNAISKSVGVLIDSRSTLENGKITKDLINEYSGGFISSYEVTNESRTKEGMYAIEISATVSSTKLYNRILELNQTKSRSTTSADQAFAQISTNIKSRSNGDKFLISIANDFPSNALNVRFPTSNIVIDENRNVSLHATYEISWKPYYLESLVETLNYVSASKCFLGLGKNLSCRYDVRVINGILSSDTLFGYVLQDNLQLNVLNNKFKDSVGIELRFYDVNNNIVGYTCVNVPLEPNNDTKTSLSLVENYNGPIIIRNNSVKGLLVQKIANQEVLKKYKIVEKSLVLSCN